MIVIKRIEKKENDMKEWIFGIKQLDIDLDCGQLNKEDC
jgi:hypothetical protein